ncbi:TetR family transcriptional regulator [Nocardia cyriacigeorgica]|uniref:TetR family transcriptional regulator n=1 Tax=Nocardia cyriacigeorgica TaxID=135487 RepID=UPI003CC7F5F1
MLAAAIQAFAETGYAATKTDDIARRAAPALRRVPPTPPRRGPPPGGPPPPPFESNQAPSRCLAR